MKVRNIYVTWTHYSEPQQQTKCSVFLDGMKTPTFEATVVLHYKDTHDRIKAMKFSLTKVMDIHRGWFTKDIRTELWEAFRTMTKVPRWGKPASDVDKFYEEAKEQYGETLQKLADYEKEEKNNIGPPESELSSASDTEELSRAEINEEPQGGTTKSE